MTAAERGVCCPLGEARSGSGATEGDVQIRGSMLHRVIVFALTVTAVAVSWSQKPVIARSGQTPSPWVRSDSLRFEIHYLPARARDFDRVVRSAERAYDRISGRLNFVLATKVPLVMYATSDPISRDDVVAYAISDAVAPQVPHRSRLVLPLPERDAELNAMMVHELTHLLMGEIILPSRPGTGGVPQWVLEGLATYMVGDWSDEDQRLLRELVASGDIPRLSQLSGDAGFANPRLNNALGHAAFDYIESRWGPASIRRFVNALIVPRVDKTYESVLDLAPAEFDEAFRQYAARRFAPVGR
jgi:hypothetical protein